MTEQVLVERATGIGPALSAWEADDLEPLTCGFSHFVPLRATYVR